MVLRDVQGNVIPSRGKVDLNLETPRVQRFTHNFITEDNDSALF